MNREVERNRIIDFLQWNDKNGCYTDENCDLEDVPRMIYEEAVKYFFYVVNEEKYSSLSESMADIEYEEAIQYAKDNNFYNSTITKLSKLVENIEQSVDIYKELINN